MTRTCAVSAAALAFVGGVLAWTSAKAWDQYPFDEYLQRSDTVTLGTGDSKEANTVTHTIDPWPRYSGNTRIPGNGHRMTGPIERYYQSVPGPKPISPLFDVGSSTGTSTGTSQ